MLRSRNLFGLRFSRWWPALFLTLLPIPAQAQTGTFTAVTYNVAALPSVPPLVIPCCDPANSVPIIATRVFAESWDIVAFQEAFVHGLNPGDNVGSLHYDTLMGNSTPGRFQFPTPDAATDQLRVASGLGKLADDTNLPFSDMAPTVACENGANDPMEYCRQRWNMLVDNDALSDKGYSVSRHTIAPMVFLDVYNLHAQAGSSEFAERADNIRQIIREINQRSEGIAVIVLGDTNSTYDRQNDVIREMLTNTTGTGGQDAPLVDVWLELARSESVPVIPTQGGTPIFPCDEVGDPAERPRSDWGGPNCEWRDKIFYRGSTDLSLTATQYFVMTDYLNSSDDDLSDHFPTGAVFSYTVPEPGVALQSLVALGSLGVLSRRRRSSR